MPISKEPSPEFLERLGRICTYWAAVEADLCSLLTFVLGADHFRTFVITQSVAGSTITNWLRTLSDMVFSPGDSREVNDLLNEIEETRGERNAFVHGIWRQGPTSDSAIVNTFRLDRSEIMKDELFTIPDLDELINRIRVIVSKLTFVGKQFGYFT